jgi:hypothetical protein
VYRLAVIVPFATSWKAGWPGRRCQSPTCVPFAALIAFPEIRTRSPAVEGSGLEEIVISEAQSASGGQHTGSAVGTLPGQQSTGTTAGAAATLTGGPQHGRIEELEVGHSIASAAGTVTDAVTTSDPVPATSATNTGASERGSTTFQPWLSGSHAVVSEPVGDGRRRIPVP